MAAQCPPQAKHLIRILNHYCKLVEMLRFLVHPNKSCCSRGDVELGMQPVFHMENVCNGGDNMANARTLVGHMVNSYSTRDVCMMDVRMMDVRMMDAHRDYKHYGSSRLV